MAARHNRRRRIVPIPETVPIASDYPYVPLIRPPPGTPWSATQCCLPEIQEEIQAFRQPLRPNPSRPVVRISPLNAPHDLPSPGRTPAWPLPLPVPVTHTPAPNTPAPYWWEPGTYPVQPYDSPVPVRLHPHIIYNPVNPSIPILQWDILHRAEQARLYTGRQVIVPVDLDVEATLPNVSQVYISSDHPLLTLWMESWGPIMVNNDSITIRDILDAIYEYFQKPLTRRDFRRISRHPQNVARLTFAAHERAKYSYELSPVSLASGFKRVDAMGGHRRFQGLRPIVYQDNTWKLFLGLLPGPVPLTS